MHAVRNIRLCTKDCLCLFVCPSGATDTENGQIDSTTCIDGCRLCVDACPSGAISLVPDEYPPQQEKPKNVVNALMQVVDSKTNQEHMAKKLAKTSEDPVFAQLMEAISESNRLMAEDIIREAGYLLPQSPNTLSFLEKLLAQEQASDFPKDVVERLVQLIRKEQPNQQGGKYQCIMCGYIYEGLLTDDLVCPICGQPASMFEPVKS